MMRSIMKFASSCAVLVLLVIAGCGDKIPIPVPEGLFGVNDYSEFATYTDPNEIKQVAVYQGRLYMLTDVSLSRRRLDFSEPEEVTGLSSASAMGIEKDASLVFVWEDGNNTLSWYNALDLTPMGSTVLSNVNNVVAMATNNAGIEQIPGALTFVYLSDSLLNVVHRYSFDEFGGLVPHGILCESDGNGARFVHLPQAMATDIDNRFLVCDADTGRNWIMRFDSTPDLTDLALDPNDPDPLRGLAFPFEVSSCITPPISDFVLGDAPACGQSDWIGGPSAEPGFMNAPRGVAVDGSGRIFVADTENDRIQVFLSDGDLDSQFGTSSDMDGLTAIALYDFTTSASTGDIFFAAFVYVVVPAENVL
ncbi:MAG: hypothetical protein ACI9UK_001233, partial [Candidatus Krumholzibacteriia bacterium]